MALLKLEESSQTLLPESGGPSIGRQTSPRRFVIQICYTKAAIRASLPLVSVPEPRNKPLYKHFPVVFMPCFLSIGPHFGVIVIDIRDRQTYRHTYRQTDIRTHQSFINIEISYRNCYFFGYSVPRIYVKLFNWHSNRSINPNIN